MKLAPKTDPAPYMYRICIIESAGAPVIHRNNCLIHEHTRHTLFYTGKDLVIDRPV